MYTCKYTRYFLPTLTLKQVLPTSTNPKTNPLNFPLSKIVCTRKAIIIKDKQGSSRRKKMREEFSILTHLEIKFCFIQPIG
jgi:hypothetical protein